MDAVQVAEVLNGTGSAANVVLVVFVLSQKGRIKQLEQMVYDLKIAVELLRAKL